MLDDKEPICLQAKPIIAGSAQGLAVVSNEPLSFWGGIDPETGEIIDRRHEKSGQSVSSRIFAFPNGKGSSTASATLLECIHKGTAPAAIINSSIDTVLALGSIVADELYGKCIPIMLVSSEDFAKLPDGVPVQIHPDGRIVVAESAREEGPK